MIRKYLDDYNAIGEAEKNVNTSPAEKRFASSHPTNTDLPFCENTFDNFEPDVTPDFDKSEKLFEGSPHSKFDYCMAITMLARKIKLSDRDLDKMLSFINAFMPVSNKCPCDIRTLKTYLFDDIKVHGNPKKIYHCNNCSKQSRECSCKTKDEKFSYFQTFDIVHQLTPLLEKYDSVRKDYKDYCLQARENGDHVDALTGSARNKYGDDVICLSLYVDGIKIRQSSSNELWILGATLLDLPIKIRSAQNNFINIMAWYGPCKPLWGAIGNLINDQLSSLIPFGEKILSIVVSQVNADMPARASLLNCMQSGYCPCLRCNVKGIRVGSTIQYQQFENTPATTLSYLNDIKKSQNSRKEKDATEFCPKGPASITHLFIPECVTSDVMHTVYYGPTHDDLKCILKNKVLIQLFDEVIETTLWPSELSNRKLRSISEINLYKASEWKNLILYITVPVLLKFLSESPNIDDLLKTQCENILQCISALLLLMKDTVSEADIYKSKVLLKKWFEGRKDIYPHNPYTQKAHEFTHFPEQVRIHGPLQASSCFAGENLLNKISNMVTSNHGDVILKQIAERTMQEIKISEWKSQQKQGHLKELILILDDKSNKVDQHLPSDSKLAETTGVSFCLKKVKIGDYEFNSSCLCESPRNSYCLFKYQNSLRFGCVEYITEVGEEIFIQIQPYFCEPLNNFQETEFNNYFKIGGKLNDPIVCNGNSVYKKGFVVTQNSFHIFVPLAHVYEHN